MSSRAEEALSKLRLRILEIDQINDGDDRLGAFDALADTIHPDWLIESGSRAEGEVERVKKAERAAAARAGRYKEQQLKAEARAEAAESQVAELKEALEEVKAKLMEHQQGESGLPFKPAKSVMRPALEIIHAALSDEAKPE